ncbi:hypothetical protein [Allorhizocola rhizosphaerae]|uniref:hypothetical protein n=1 Tax=Allorhizocola rhizosphaerae TaxID=1872709 RepID=UPI0013C2F5DB|nr:hypothetical protein [Allorhizocola rhizosphaerae]
MLPTVAGGDPYRMKWVMNSRLSARLLITASIGYGIAVAILGYLGSSALALVAIVGALVLGGLWAIRGVFMDR